MATRLYNRVKIDIGLVPSALNNTNATGAYYPVANFGRILAILSGGAMAAGKTTTVELLQAQDAAGSGSKGIPTDAGQKATATITANTAVTEATLTVASAKSGDIVKVNGVTFTAHATTTTVAKGEFDVGDNNTECATALAQCINALVPGVTATSALAVVTLKPTIPGETVITIEDAAATITAATLKAQAYVEIDAGDLSDGFTHVAAKVTTTANTVCGVTLLRGDGRYSPVQKVGARAAI